MPRLDAHYASFSSSPASLPLLPRSLQAWPGGRQGAAGGSSTGLEVPSSAPPPGQGRTETPLTPLPCRLLSLSWDDALLKGKCLPRHGARSQAPSGFFLTFTIQTGSITRAASHEQELPKESQKGRERTFPASAPAARPSLSCPASAASPSEPPPHPPPLATGRPHLRSAWGSVPEASLRSCLFFGTPQADGPNTLGF